MIRETNFAAVLKYTRFKEKMQHAVRLVVMGKISYTEAGKRVNVSRQAVHKAVKSFYKTCDLLGAEI
jgi:predicted DNA-binding protein (UPF0251 family)